MFDHIAELAFRHAITENHNLFREIIVHFIVLFDCIGKGDFQRVNKFLANHLKAYFRVPSRLLVVQARHKASYGLVTLFRLMINIDADDHELLDRYFQTPQFAAQLAIHLEQDLLGHGSQLLFIEYRFRNYDLRWHRIVNATQPFHGRIAVIARRRKYDHNHLHLVIQVPLDFLYVCVRAVVVQFDHNRLAHPYAHLLRTLAHLVCKLFGHLGVRTYEHNCPRVQVDGTQDTSTTDLIVPVALVVRWEFIIIAQNDSLSVEQTTIELNKK